MCQPAHLKQEQGICHHHLATVYTRLLARLAFQIRPSSIDPECRAGSRSIRLPKMHVEHLRVSRGSRKL